MTLWAYTDTTWNFQLSSFFQDNFTTHKPLKLKADNFTTHKLKADYQRHPSTLVYPVTINNKKISVTLHWFNLMFWFYQYTTTPQFQMLNYFKDKILTSMHCTYTTWDFQAIILLSLCYNYTNYNQQSITLQSQTYTYKTYIL